MSRNALAAVGQSRRRVTWSIRPTFRWRYLHLRGYYPVWCCQPLFFWYSESIDAEFHFLCCFLEYRRLENEALFEYSWEPWLGSRKPGDTPRHCLQSMFQDWKHQVHAPELSRSCGSKRGNSEPLKLLDSDQIKEFRTHALKNDSFVRCSWHVIVVQRWS